MRARLSHAERRRAALVGTVAAILDQGQPTRFAYEGACRHGVRGAFILSGGWPWQAADAAAAEIIESAFKRLGVSRPTWLQGQPEYVEVVDGDHMACLRCGKSLEGLPAPTGRVRKYCSKQCLAAHNVYVNRRYGERLSRAEWAAKVAAETEARAAARTRTCPTCGGAFTVKTRNHPKQFCSSKCYGAAKRGKARNARVAPTS